ncbi:MAG TPA: hypothetical protein VE136_13705 [Anaerolineales bacterium]|jgi:predicted nucleic acid-binding protein|nr:hypothetical protein [Anaerolineales bacterium]
MPDLDRIVIANTTPIISLALIGKLDLLQRLYGQIYIPSAVEAEILAGGESRIGGTELKDATYIQAKSLSDPGRAALPSNEPLRNFPSP